MPNFSKEAVRFARCQRLKLSQRLVSLDGRMEKIAVCLLNEGAAMPACTFQTLLSEYRILQRNYDITQGEFRKLSSL